MESIKIAVDVDASAVKEATETLNEIAAAAERAKAALDALLDKGVVVSTSSCPSPPADRMVDRKSPKNWTDSRASHEVNGGDEPEIDDRIYVSERYNGRYSESLRMLLDVLSK